MDNNASSSPDPDATTRRRSGRVVRAPTKFTPDTTTQSTNPKRKRDDQDDEEEDEEEDAEIEAPDSDEEMSNEPDNDSDEDHPAPRSRKKSSQTSRAKKPSAKKPKINGSKPLRPARVTHAAKSLPSRPKKSVRIEDAAVKGHGLYCRLKFPFLRAFLHADTTKPIYSDRVILANRWQKNGWLATRQTQ